MRRSAPAAVLLLLAACLVSSVARADDAPPDVAPPPGPPPIEGESPSAAPPPEEAPPPPSPTPAFHPAPAQTEPIEHDHTPPLGLLPMAGDSLIDPRMARSWSASPPRWFAATTVDIGFVYIRPRVSLGYGKPFSKWFGVDLNPVVSGNGLGAYGGLRLEVPYLDLRAGARWFGSFNRTYLKPEPAYDRIQLETESGSPSRVVTLESELDVAIPAGPGNILARGSVSYVMGVPDGSYVFEETLRIIINPPLIWRARGGYELRLGKYHQHGIGFVTDFLAATNRDDSKTVRMGPVLRWVLSRRVEVRGSFVLTVYSPDRIGLVGSDFTELGVRYRWATE